MAHNDLKRTSTGTRCPQCKGQGSHFARIPDHGKRELVDAIVGCVYPGCHNGTVDLAENQRIITPFASCPIPH